MKLTKTKLRNLIREEIQKLNEKSYGDLDNSLKNIHVSYKDLTSLKGAPEKVAGYFDCNNNKLTSLKGAPKTVGGSFLCRNNAKKFTEEEVRAVCKVRGNIYV